VKRSRRANPIARAVLAGWLALAGCTGAVLAQPAATQGYAGTGDAVVQTNLAGAALTIGANVAFEARGDHVRLDVLSIAVPGTDPTISALAGSQLFPPGGFTIVYDRVGSTMTVWSTAKRTYYVIQKPTSSATNAPTAVPAGGNLSGILGALRGFKDDRSFSASVTMTGHTTLFGHPVTGLGFHVSAVPITGSALDVQGEFQLADDLDAFPLRLTATIAAGTFPASSLRVELPTLTKAAPRDADFAPPAGFTAAATLGGVLGRSLP
jgi:hypothetical protein